MKPIKTFTVNGIFKIIGQVGRPQKALASASIYETKSMDSEEKNLYNIEEGMNYMVDLTRCISSDYYNTIRQYISLEDALNDAKGNMIGIDGIIREDRN